VQHRRAGDFAVRRIDDDGAAQLAADKRDASLVEELRRFVRDRQVVLADAAAASSAVATSSRIRSRA